jgi:tRNA-specific 2-thiouridylase
MEAADDHHFTLRFSDPQWAVTPGQSAVVYDGEVCLGGGVITSDAASVASLGTASSESSRTAMA